MAGGGTLTPCHRKMCSSAGQSGRSGDGRRLSGLCVEGQFSVEMDFKL